MFQIPENVPYGRIYYVTREKQVSHGATAHVEQLPSGHVVKYPKSNPYSPKKEEDHRRNMRIEAGIYQLIGDCPYIPRMIDWEPESCSLTLEYLEGGDLAKYMRETAQIPGEIRQRWTLQAAAALSALHAANIIHCDFAPRNFILGANLDLHIADFAGSSVAGSTPTIAAGPRYLPPGWSWTRPVQQTDDVFALGSVMYFIMVGEEPYADLSEEDVEKKFAKAVFPDELEVYTTATTWARLGSENFFPIGLR
ncbi:cAMP-dependent protein kinase type-like protein [Hapsidospora chrysogenum ATCC 11550]|uniref:EKC/KEOPS complex subunit BUD32 n=1 Tax=Hapsidospora chrysogenum (strain ATCC 11550 / CBS 779.69 / DSM 880 / IAM 14645 / JCM 23072 / IMI 49137) TaxID=857340 RepID=A0A086STR1_HAPC1|nr:cAMP-dependent protein kinase type-like protein [Hapsidospora chrysogenum ATCC 11550]